MLKQWVQSHRGGHTALDVLAEPHGIDREQTAFNSVKEERNDPATNYDKRNRHAAMLLLPDGSSASPTTVVFSSKISSIRLRPARRTVMARRGISSCVPDSGQ